MNKTFVFIFAAGVIAGTLPTALIMKPEKPGPTPQQQQQLLSYLTVDCAKEIYLVGPNPTCELGSVTVNTDRNPTRGWLCNKAWMPEKLQQCLEDAFNRLLDEQNG